MPNTVIIGAQWGDEGKGKLVDMLSEQSDVIVRFQGGNNAGHTILCGDKQTILHLIPSGILHPKARCLIGNGVVLDPFVFLEEVASLGESGIRVDPSRLGISYKTHLILPYHKVMDAARESARTKDKIGTTGRGIGPCYEDKMARVGIRACDLMTPSLVHAKITRALAEKNVLFTHLYGCKPLDPAKVSEDLLAIAPKIIPYLVNVEVELKEAEKKGARILFEGAQGTHLDIDHGTYPFVTSSNTVAANAATGSGIGANKLTQILGIVKAYTTRVGEGAFPTELFDATGELLQRQGHEFGATTGRKRRCGWLDCVLLRASVCLNGITDIALTKLDVLSGLSTIKVCTAYSYKGEIIPYPPQQENALAEVEPVYEELPGFDGDISGIHTFDALPQAVQAYVRRIEELVAAPVRYISVGPERNQTIVR